MSAFLELIRLASAAPDNNVRKENEEKLIQYRSKEPLKFLEDSMTSFNDSSIDAGIRQAIATIIKVSFSSEIVTGQGIWWYHIPEEYRNEVKKVCLQNLISPRDAIKNASADVASIFNQDHFDNLRLGLSIERMARTAQQSCK